MFTLLLSRMKMLSKVNHALKDEVFLSSFLKLIKKKHVCTVRGYLKNTSSQSSQRACFPKRQRPVSNCRVHTKSGNGRWEQKQRDFLLFGKKGETFLNTFRVQTNRQQADELGCDLYFSSCVLKEEARGRWGGMGVEGSVQQLSFTNVEIPVDVSASLNPGSHL